MAACAPRFGKQIGRQVAGDLDGEAWARLRRHVADCAPCRDQYNRAARAARLLEGGAAAIDGPVASELARIGEAVVQQATPPRRPLGAWILGLVTASATAALVPLLLFAPAPVADGPELVARGGATSEPLVGLRAFCLRPGAGDGALRALEARGRCATGELLKLVYGNPGGRPELFLVGVDGRFAIKWYEPRPPSTVSVPAAKGAELPLPGAIRLGVNHQPGPLRIFALVGEAPIAAREIEGAVEELRRRRLDLADVETLPLPDRDDVAQRSLLIEVTAGLP